MPPCCPPCCAVSVHSGGAAACRSHSLAVRCKQTAGWVAAVTLFEPTQQRFPGRPALATPQRCCAPNGSIPETGFAATWLQWQRQGHAWCSWSWTWSLPRLQNPARPAPVFAPWPLARRSSPHCRGSHVLQQAGQQLHSTKVAQHTGHTAQPAEQSTSQCAPTPLSRQTPGARRSRKAPTAVLQPGMCAGSACGFCMTTPCP